jgi:manganese/zinc/iron transport system permease protein
MEASFFAHYYTVILVMVGTTLLGATAGAIGVFAVLRKQSLLGDTLSHAALPGIALAFLITKNTHPITLMLGGSIAGVIATALLMLILRTTTLKIDTVLGIMLSVFFGFGLVLMTMIQKEAYAQHTMLNTFIFGNAATLLTQDIYAMIFIATLVLVSLALWWKECTLVTFDPCFAHTIGHSTFSFEILMTALLIVTVIIGLQTVGVILMSAMIIAPAAAAQQWTNRIHQMIFIAALIGAICGIAGTILSNYYDHVPTGPTIVILLSLVVLISFKYPYQKNLSCE